MMSISQNSASITVVMIMTGIIITPLFSEETEKDLDKQNRFPVFAFGALPIHVFGGSKKHFKKAFVDANGIIRVSETYQHFNTTLPAVTAYWRCSDTFGGIICPPLGSNAFFGITLGYDEIGKSGEKGGRMAIGFSIGVRSVWDDLYLGIVIGGYFDSTMNSLPSDFPIDGPFLYFGESKQPSLNPNVDEIALANATIDSVTRRATGRYGFIGVVVTWKIFRGLNSSQNSQESNEGNKG